MCPTGFVLGSKIYPSLYKLLKDFEQNPRSVPSFNWKSEIEVRRFKWITQKKPWGDDLGIRGNYGKMQVVQKLIFRTKFFSFI